MKVVYSDPTFKQCPVIEALCSHDKVKGPTYLIIEAWTFGIGLIVLKIAIIVETTWIQRYCLTYDSKLKT